MEGLLHSMPKRKTDHATVVQRKAVLKLGVEEAECKHIQRDKGLEKQFRMKCKSCGVPICYQNKPFGYLSPKP